MIMENSKYNALNLVHEITNILDEEMKHVAQNALEVSYKTMLRDRKFEDTFELDYVKDFCSSVTYNESSLIQYVLNAFRDNGYVAEYSSQNDNFQISVPQSVFVEVAKQENKQ